MSESEELQKALAAAAESHHRVVRTGKLAARKAAAQAHAAMAAMRGRKKTKSAEWKRRQAVWDEQELLLRSTVSTKVLDRRRERLAGTIQGRWRRRSAARGAKLGGTRVDTAAAEAAAALAVEAADIVAPARRRLTVSAVHARVAKMALEAERSGSAALQAIASASLERLSAEDRELLPDEALWTMRSGAMQQLRLAAACDAELKSEATARADTRARLAHIAQKVSDGDVASLDVGEDLSGRERRAAAQLRRRVQISLDRPRGGRAAWWNVPAQACARVSHSVEWDAGQGFDIRATTARCDFPSSAVWEESKRSSTSSWWADDAAASQKWTLWSGGELPFRSAAAAKDGGGFRGERRTAVARIDALSREMVAAAYGQVEPRKFEQTRRGGSGAGGATRRRRGGGRYTPAFLAAAQAIQDGWRDRMERKRAQHNVEHYEQLASVIERCEEALTMAKQAFQTAKVDEVPAGGSTMRGSSVRSSSRRR